MATAKPLPLPPDYVRPSPAEFKAAGFVPSEYETYFSRHEAELRTHHARVAPPVVTEEEVLELDVGEDVTDPTDTEPAPPSEPPGPPMSLAEMAAARAGTSAAAAAETLVGDLPVGYTRPTLEEFTRAGYDSAAYEGYFQRYEAKLRAAGSATGDEVKTE